MCEEYAEYAYHYTLFLQNYTAKIFSLEPAVLKYLTSVLIDEDTHFLVDTYSSKHILEISWKENTKNKTQD